MCGENGGKGSKGSSGGRKNSLGKERSMFGTNVTAADYARTAGMMGSMGDGFMKSARAQNPDAFGGGNAMGGGMGTSGQPAPGQKATLGTPKAKPTKAAGTLMARPQAAKPSLQGVYGVMGIEGISETEEAYTGSSLNPFDGAEISTSKDFGWDFSKGKTTGSIKATPNRGPGAIRDGIAAAVGSPYDRDITPDRARDMLSKGPGTLSTWTQGLSDGNYQYDEHGKPDVDRFGMAYDAVSPIARAIVGDMSGALTGARTAINTAVTHDKLSKAGVFGAPKSSPTVASHQRASITTPGSTGPATAMLGNDENRERVLMTPRSSAPQQVAEAKPKRAEGVLLRSRRGKSTLNLTGSQGLKDRPKILMQKLWGAEEKKRQPVLMQHTYK